ncbi:hypothetical protein NBRC110019_07380 [Neptunitalea chrysea]|uniref:Uncharacterized protein n=1 Tax=Neptunitalea chrysea TaxID=1647581 RepID=A0A9W6B3E1_9FLAO|nr:hypothetical protein [Neptunitalea chrysea]GLB51699.1 hypothetical protein NBRC110019_07380 [Neptunitalea chrysea]
MRKGILLNDDNDLQASNGGIVIGNTQMQEVALILQLSQGAQKFSPTLGPNLVQLKKTGAPRFDIEQRVRVHLAKDNIDYETIKQQLKTNINES